MTRTLMEVVRRGLGQLTGHGGWFGAAWQFLRVADLKTGTLVGQDHYGNCYYEDTNNFFGRHRWIDYTSSMNGKYTYWDVDASMIPPEWHLWLHSITDHPPTTHPPVPRKFIWKQHQFNFTGTDRCYVPYSTTPPKIHAWKPVGGQ
uniref:NADH dehydrogenase [ubiquinone] 1 alpha subcomplex subunit 12 n=1 Tax=Myxine glutinosa TaxID=7769 RepID=UPI00358E398E